MKRTFGSRAIYFASLLGIALAVHSSKANAAIVAPVGAQASSDVGGVRTVSGTIDGVAAGDLDPAITDATVSDNPLSPTFIGNWKHNSLASGAWLSNNTEQVCVTFDLGSVQTVAGIWVWNNITNKPAFPLASDGFDRGYQGIKDVTAWKTDAASNVAPHGGSDVQIPGISQFNRSPGTPLVTGLPAPATNLTFFHAPTYYPFTSAVTAQFIKLDITDSWNPGNGGNPLSEFGDSFSFTGTGEIRFQTVASIPEPTSATLIILGAFGCIRFTRRRRNRD